MKKQYTSRRFVIRTATALLAVCCLSPLAAVAQEYANRGPNGDASILDASPVQSEPRSARGREQPAYRFGFLEYEGNDAGEQTVIPGFDWRSPTTGTAHGYDD